MSSPRRRARELGVVLGEGEPGPLNAITDVAGVRVGHVTLDDPPVRTGVTVVVPHGGNLFREKVPCGAHVINGFGKATGLSQIAELGSLETPIALTNTLCVGAAFEGLVRDALARNPEIGATSGTVNPVVAECNDQRLSDLRGLHVRPEHVVQAIAAAAAGPVAEGSVGAGTGMICYGWKGGVGTASRRTSFGWTLGVLVVTNFGRPQTLTIAGVPIDRLLGRPDGADGAGSCVAVVATDAPADSRQLGRIARRVQSGLARQAPPSSTGAASTRSPSRRRPGSRPGPTRRRFPASGSPRTARRSTRSSRRRPRRPRKPSSTRSSRRPTSSRTAGWSATPFPSRACSRRLAARAIPASARPRPRARPLRRRGAAARAACSAASLRADGS